MEPNQNEPATTPAPYAAGTGASAPGGEPDEVLRRAFGLGRV